MPAVLVAPNPTRRMVPLVLVERVAPTESALAVARQAARLMVPVEVAEGMEAGALVQLVEGSRAAMVEPLMTPR